MLNFEEQPEHEDNSELAELESSEEQASAVAVATKKIAVRSFKFRIYPTKAQITTFNHWLDLCRHLYNAALEQRRNEWKHHKRNITFNIQSEQLTELKKTLPEYATPYGQVLQNVLRRVDKTFKAFFVRCKRGDTPGYPRFKSASRYNSFTYPQERWSIHNNRLTLGKIPGTIKIKRHREVIGKVKTCTVKREAANKWFVIFAVETELDASKEHEGTAVGIDLGLEYFASLSTGEQVENPRFLKKAKGKLVKTQRKLARLQHEPRNHPGKKAAKKSVGRAYKHVANQRRDFAFKEAGRLTTEFSIICIEDLLVANLVRRPKPKEDESNPGTYLPNGASAKSGLNRSISDVGWSLFTTILEHKAESAGARIVKVNPAYTSQTCPDCNAVKPKELSERWHSCPCGCELPRDVAAAKVILSRGLSTLGIQSVDAPAARCGE